MSRLTAAQRAAQDFVCMYSMYGRVCSPGPDPDPDADQEFDVFMHADLCISSCELLAQDHRVLAFYIFTAQSYHPPP